MTQKRSAAGSRAGIPNKSARKYEQVTHKGHEIAIPSDDPGWRVLVDGEPIRHRQVGDEFYLDATTVPQAGHLPRRAVGGTGATERPGRKAATGRNHPAHHPFGGCASLVQGADRR